MAFRSVVVDAIVWQTATLVLLCAALLSCYAVSGAPSHPVKTIKTEEGDIFDCVDIYKQPAFDHPLLKDHKILRRPSVLRRDLPKVKSQGSKRHLRHSILKGRGCPKGTVPIHRLHKDDSTPWASLTSTIPDNSYASKVWAIRKGYTAEYYGASASLEVYDVEPLREDQMSGSLVWACRSDVHSPFSCVVAGWMASHALFNDTQTRLYTEWEIHQGKAACVNMQCPGFVQVSRHNPLGGAIRPLSTYKGQLYVIDVHLYEDIEGNWWFQLGEEDVGYWPATIFNNFTYASEVYFGGFAMCSASDGECPQMGNGHSPKEDVAGACYVNRVQAMDRYGWWQNLSHKKQFPYQTKPECYNVGPYEHSRESFNSFGFGGPRCNQSAYG